MKCYVKRGKTFKNSGSAVGEKKSIGYYGKPINRDVLNDGNVEGTLCEVFLKTKASQKD